MRIAKTRLPRRPFSLFDQVGIHRLMWRGGKKPYVIFRCSFAAREWLQTIEDSTIEVRHMDCGPLDNPHAGERVCLIKNIRPSEAWIKRFHSFDEYDGTETPIYVAAECDIEWELFPMFEAHDRRE